jgi:hypothetical protein
MAVWKNGPLRGAKNVYHVTLCLYYILRIIDIIVYNIIGDAIFSVSNNFMCTQDPVI